MIYRKKFILRFRKVVLLFLLILAYFGCNDNNSKDYLCNKVLNSNLKTVISNFIKENPKDNLFGLYFIKFHQDTSYYLLVTLGETKENILRNKPDDIVKIEGKFVLINYSINNLYAYDSLNAMKTILELQNDNFIFKKDEASTFTHLGILVKVINGRYFIQKDGFSTLDIPTIGIRPDTIYNEEYIPNLEELKKYKDSM